MDEQNNQIEQRRTMEVISHDYIGVRMDMERAAAENGGVVPERLVAAEHALLAEMQGKGMGVLHVRTTLRGQGDRLIEMGEALIASGKARHNDADRVEDYFIRHLEGSGAKEFVGEDGFRFVLRRNTASVEVVNPKLVYMTQPKVCGLEPAEDCVVVDGQAMRVKPDKVALRKLLEEGEAIVAGAHLNEPTYRLEIKP